MEACTFINRLLFIVIIFFIGSCAGENYSDLYESPEKAKNFTFEKIDEWVLSHPSTDRMGEIIGKLRFEFVSNRNYTLNAFFDEINKHFVITDHRGVIQHVLSGEGRGPGEVVGVEGFFFDEGDRLIAYDVAQAMFKIFDIKSENFKDVDVDRTEFTIANRQMYAVDGFIYAPIIGVEYLGLDSREKWQSPLIGIYDYNGTLIEVFGEYDPAVEDAKDYDNYAIMHIDSNNEHIMTTRQNDYRIQVYDMISHNRLKWFGRKTQNFHESEEYISQFLPQHEILSRAIGLSRTVGIYTSSDYIISQFGIISEEFYQTYDPNNRDHFIVVYDRETYDSYGEIAVPYQIGNVADNKFYLIEDDNPDNFTIGVYELREAI